MFLLNQEVPGSNLGSITRRLTFISSIHWRKPVYTKQIPAGTRDILNILIKSGTPVKIVRLIKMC
jgi:hypothetical protein